MSPGGGKQDPLGKRPAPIPPEEVAQLVRDIVERSGPIIISKHFRRQGRDERDFDIDDALEAFRTFDTSPKAVWNTKRLGWNYDVRGTDLEGDQSTVRVAFSPTRTQRQTEPAAEETRPREHLRSPGVARQVPQLWSRARARYESALPIS